jgi:hypothetical protein
VPARGFALDLFVRQVFWVVVSAVVLSAAFGAVVGLAMYEPPPPNAVLSTWPTAGGLALNGAFSLGLIGSFGGIAVGFVLGLLHVLVAPLRGLADGRPYRWLMPMVGLGVGLFLGRLGTAMVVYQFFSDFEIWSLGWNPEDFPSMNVFLEIVVVPTLLVGFGSWWATERTVVWFIRESPESGMASDLR